MSAHDPLTPLVREYLAAREALAAIELRVADIAEHDRRALAPFTDALRAAERAHPELASEGLSGALWSPRDRAGLTAIDDLYAVIGRFAFEGDDGENLRAFSRALDAVRARISTWESHLSALGEAPGAAKARAEAIEASAHADERSQRDALLARFEPEAAALREMCGKVLDAVRAAERPDLTAATDPAARYDDYVRKVNGLYARALPFLREALADLSKVAGVETPPNWPDTLPFEAALGDELITPPSRETPALLQARQLVEELTEQEAALARGVDELGVQARRVDSELAARRERDQELEREAQEAQAIARWAAKLDELDLAKQRVAAVNAEGARVSQALAQLASEAQRVGADIARRQHEATERAQLVAAKEAALEAHRGDEPFFGKDEWRRRGESLDGELDALRAELTAQQQQLATLHAELGRLRAREPLEQAQLAALGRQLEQMRAEEAAAQRDANAIETSLGAARPPRRVTTAQAEELLSAVSAARAEVRANIERHGAERRRVQADIDRGTVQQRQVATEREKAAQALQAAFRAATTRFEELSRVQGVRRQQAFQRHVDEVLGALEESLTQVDRVFIDPAREALLARAGVSSDQPERLRAQAIELEVALPALRDASRAAMDGAREELARIDAWIDGVAPRCRAAWSA